LSELLQKTPREGENEMKDFEITGFRRNLTDWYRIHGRDLPWRHTKNPYYIWISEIMLQQTQVDTVKNYYHRFTGRFPEIRDLAEASEDDVFKLWEGLGYYRRAANMICAARTVMTKYGGHFPETYEDIRSLKGIGSYTASAISSIAFQIPKGVVDGNTLRIISRIYNRQDNIAKETTKKEYQKIMDTLIDPKNPSDFNQGMMDLGATVCTPKHPRCAVCPVASYCDALAAGTAGLLPVNIHARNKNETELVTAVIKYKDKYLLVKNREGLLQNLYGLVQFEVQSPAAFEDAFLEKYGTDVRLTEFGKTVKHVFTHKIWLMNGYLGQITEKPDRLLEKYPDTGLYTPAQIRQLPVSTAHQKILKLFL